MKGRGRERKKDRMGRYIGKKNKVYKEKQSAWLTTREGKLF